MNGTKEFVCQSHSVSLTESKPIQLASLANPNPTAINIFNLVIPIKKYLPIPPPRPLFPFFFLLCIHTSHGKIQSKSIEIIYKAFIMQANMCIHIILLLFNLLCKRAHKTCFKVLAAWHQNVMYLIINEFTTKLIRTYQCMYITKSPFLRSS